jgi:HD superfamily phosphodiesterase
MSSVITTAITDKLVDHVAEYVKKELASHDASHDWWHVYRVAQNALHLGKLESLSQDSLCIVRLAALLHDVKDWKYGGTQQESESVITVGTNAEADIRLDGNMWPPKRRFPWIRISRLLGLRLC